MNAKLGIAAAVLAAFVACGDKAPPAPAAKAASVAVAEQSAAKEKEALQAGVEAVDTARQTVRLRGVERTIDLQVRDPKQLALVKVSDPVEATFTEAVAFSVEVGAGRGKGSTKEVSRGGRVQAAWSATP